jgi:hypothetical protein
LCSPASKASAARWRHASPGSRSRERGRFKSAPEAAGHAHRTQVADLRAALTKDGRQREAAGIIRKLVDRIELSPVIRSGRKGLSVSLYGRLAGIRAMATKAKAPLDESDASVMVTKLVAGVGFEPTTFRL